MLFPPCKSPQKYWFPFSVNSGLLPLPGTWRPLRAHIVNESIFSKHSWGVSSHASVTDCIFQRWLQWYLSLHMLFCDEFLPLLQWEVESIFPPLWIWLSLVTLWPRVNGGSNADVVGFLCTLCLGCLECLPLGSSLLWPSHHIVKSLGNLERLWLTA